MEECLLSFARPEIIEDWKCEKCAVSLKNQLGDKSEDELAIGPASRTDVLDSVPPILTIHLLRFNSDADGNVIKLPDHVEFKYIVSLRSCMHRRYDLTLSYFIIA